MLDNKMGLNILDSSLNIVYEKEKISDIIDVNKMSFLVDFMNE
jgi:hypothetical protein